MPKYGKIHSMPEAFRIAASELLDAGKTEQQVADWLNAKLAEANSQELPADVNQQNVNAWKKSGYQRWIKSARQREIARELARIGTTDDPAKPDHTDGLATAAAAELIVELGWIKANMEPGEARAKALSTITQQIVSLRRSNQERAWLRIAAQKTKIGLLKLEVQTGVRVVEVEKDVPKGITEETMDQIDKIMAVVMNPDSTQEDYDNIELDTMDQKQGERMLQNMKEASARM